MRLTTLAALTIAAFALCQPCRAAAPDPACIAEIKAILQASVSSGPFRIVNTQRNTPDNVPIEITFEMVPPNAMHTISTFNGQPSEMTYVDGRGYLKLGDTWTELPPQQAATLITMFDPETLEASLATVEAADCARPTMAYGKPALFYHLVTSTTGLGNDISITVDPETRLPVEIYNYPNNAGTPAGPDSDSLYTYDPSIVIKAPL